MNTFPEFQLLPSLLETLAEKNLQKPTPIQARAVSALMSGRSIVGVAQTGSGKTLAYALPILHVLKTLETGGKGVTQERHPRAAILVPTRELGEQVAKVFKSFTHDTRLRVRSVLGGTTTEVAKKNLDGYFEILIATPGRLIQMLDRKLVNLNEVKFLLFDEADQMLDDGFLKDAQRISDACPVKCQLAMFTATFTAEVEKLVGHLFDDADIIRVEGGYQLPATLTTRNQVVADGDRRGVLEKLLREKTSGGTMIFSNTRQQCDKLAEVLDECGHSYVMYRGEMDKVERRKNLQAFRDGKIPFLLSTDLASRGLDLENVGRVINYHLPQELENYVHRVGRTARAGRKGLVVNLVTERDQSLMDRLKRLK
jgi:superfamily II DNA/RNA helicase